MADNIKKTEDNFFSSLAYKYIPYWPLFIGLLVLLLFGAWAYLRLYAIPTYEVSASIIIKDENKGVSESKITESMDNFTANKVVENEINVIHSRALIKKLVYDLKLYTPVFEETKIKSLSAYTSSPITIELKNPEKAKIFPKIYFKLDKTKKKVIIGNDKYSLNKWINTPYGILRFSKNINQTQEAEYPLFFSIQDPNIVIDGLLTKIRIQASSKFSTVINLYLKETVPQRGEDILNNLILSYKEMAINDRKVLAANTLKFVEDRIARIVEELNSLEKKVVQFKSTQGSVNLSEQSKLYLENVRDNDRKISEINTQLAVLDKIENYVLSKNSLDSFVPSTLGINDPSLTQLLNKLYETEIQYEKLKNTTAENNPVLISITNEIGNIRPRILENIRNQRANLKASRTNLSSTNNSYISSLQSIPEKERELTELTRQQAVKNNAYSFLLQKREETVLSYAPTAEDSKVIDMAGTSQTPISPKPLYIYLAAIIMACILGITFITAKELLNNKLLFRTEIANNTNAPIVAELSYIKQHNENLFTAPKEAAVIEQFRQLRVTLGLYGRTFTKKKILVTSSIPGEGKSYVSSNLALSLSTSGKKVILIDFDLRNPNISVQFDLYKQKGVIEYLGEEVNPSEIIRSTDFNNLSIIPAGINIGDHTELLLNEKLEILLDFLEERFDYLVIDTPPVDLVSDAYLLSEYSDITLLVMRHAYTPKTLVQRLVHSNKIKSLNNVAIVFNGVKSRGFGKGQYGYGYGYGYENKYKDKVYGNRSATAKA